MISTMFGPSSEVFGEFNRLLDEMLRPSGRGSIRALAGASFPIINVGTTPESVEVMALAPGLDPKDLQLTVDRGLLTIAGERPSELPNPDDDAIVYAQERFVGNFRRVINLPDEVDASKVDASYRDGVLRVTIAKRESSRPRRIDIS